MNIPAACVNMIKQQLRTGGVLDESILQLFIDIPREAFVPQPLKAFAYSDMQIPLAHRQRMFTPLEEGLILQGLHLQGHETVLEIGTGHGFLTALLSRLCKKVISIDYYADFSHTARQQLAQHQCHNVEFITGDAHQGWLEQAPYDIILLTGGLETLNDTLRLQVLPGGKLFALIGRDPVFQAQIYSLDHNNQWHKTMLFNTNLPSLIAPSKIKEFVF